MNQFKLFFILILFFSVNHVFAKEQKVKLLTKSPQQGSLILGQYQGDGEIYFNNKKLARNPDGIFVFGVGRDAPKKVTLILNENNTKSSLDIAIKKRQWKVEKIDGLPPSKVSPIKPEILKRIRQEGALVKKARNQFTKSSSFTMPFITPAKGRISGVYGSQRILNGIPKRPHFGLDIANKTGTPVVAPIDGVVALVHPDMFYSGGTLIIDHGYGISSTYIHLDTIDVKKDQVVKQGEKIGTIGATGRVTGPHLDWRLNWFQTRLDPQLMLNDVNN